MTSHGLSCRIVALIVAGIAIIGTGAAAIASAPGYTIDREGASRIAQEHAAALELTVRTCQGSYEVGTPVATPAAGCNQPAGDTTFALTRDGVAGPSASTGTSGNSPQESTVRFTNLSPGHYLLTATMPEEIATAFIASCTSNARDLSTYPFSPFAWVEGGQIELDLRPGETLACDWYQVQQTANS